MTQQKNYKRERTRLASRLDQETTFTQYGHVTEDNIFTDTNL